MKQTCTNNYSFLTFSASFLSCFFFFFFLSVSFILPPFLSSKIHHLYLLILPGISPYLSQPSGCIPISSKTHHLIVSGLPRTIRPNPPPHPCGPKQPKIQTEVLGHSLAHLLAPLTRSLAPDCLLRSRPPLRSLVRSLAHFAHSLTRGKVNF